MKNFALAKLAQKYFALKKCALKKPESVGAPNLFRRPQSKASLAALAALSALTFASFIFKSPAAQAQGAPQCQVLFTKNLTSALRPDLQIYESGRDLALNNARSLLDFKHGWQVTQRDFQGNATSARLQILVDNPGLDQKIQVVGPFNNWGKSLRPGDTLRSNSQNPELFAAQIDGLQHGVPYRLVVNGHQVLDPTARFFTTPEYLERQGSISTGDYLNSIFWDQEHPGAYQMQSAPVDLRDTPVLITENEAHTMVEKWTDKSGQRGPRIKAETYRFIADSGVIEFLHMSGINTIEMLPFNQSMDGDAWNLRYQVYGLFAPDSRYGTPDEFRKMIDTFHKNGISVVMDSVISHFPFKGNGGDREMTGLGLDQWYKANGQKLFAGDMSPWDTFRYDYSNPYVRRMLIESVLYMMKEYGIDGVRFDNVDGIRGTAGGDQLLTELNSAIRAFNPATLLIAEAFFTSNTLLFRQDQGGTGMNAKTDSDNFEIWRNSLQGLTENLNVQAMGDLLRNLWSWRVVSQLRYITNHDESANGRGGMTGAYPASLLGNDSFYAVGKIKASEAFNMLSGAYHLSIPQARLMQTGTFYSNAAVDWDLLKNDGRSAPLWNYFSKLNRYVTDRSPFFNFASLSPDIANHEDNTNKVISLKRTNPNNGKAIYILINLGHKEISQYRFGVTQAGHYRVAFDGDRSEFAGSNHLNNALPSGEFDSDAQGAHSKPFSLIVPVVAPYSLTIFEPTN